LHNLKNNSIQTNVSVSMLHKSEANKSN